ncbi:HNH endonuclease [Geomonas paludis]|uniref:HNH endonuclease n=1 Tax=Geomonas paludis TaxID=2740185 RepID=A0A6V8N1D7_9BACT|nr:HNH endonuclease signature motif containing protein [Geomonas paludis]UPU36613.1 HNH endonuclease [Geomonas paludis]GFO65874.1 hypothetical protein GMPD_37930 [Geomonas paludis]
MKKHLVTLHCGREMLVTNAGQRYCNRDCAAFFVTRRHTAKSAKKVEKVVVTQALVVESIDPQWGNAKVTRTSQGYRLLTLYFPSIRKRISRFEHIVVWERCHARKVPEGWVLHHVNEHPLDNDPSNLVALPKGLHRELHVRLKHLAQSCTGIDYIVNRYRLTRDFVRRSTELDDLRKGWQLEG